MLVHRVSHTLGQVPSKKERDNPTEKYWKKRQK